MSTKPLERHKHTAVYILVHVRGDMSLEKDMSNKKHLSVTQSREAVCCDCVSFLVHR